MIRAIRRFAFAGAAAVAGFLGLAGVQSRAMARLNVESVRQADSYPTRSSTVPAGRITQGKSIRGMRLNRGEMLAQTNAVWIGAMRPGGGPVWPVGRRGGNRMRGRGVRV